MLFNMSRDRVYLSKVGALSGIYCASNFGPSFKQGDKISLSAID